MIETICHDCCILLQHKPRTEPVHCPKCVRVLRFSSGLTFAEMTALCNALMGTTEYPAGLAQRMGLENVNFRELVADIETMGLKTRFNGTAHIWRYCPKQDEERVWDAVDKIVMGDELDSIMI